MKVLIIHPPLYEANIELYNLLGKCVDLKVISLGEYPRYHPEWHVNNLKHQVKHFDLISIGAGYITTKKSLNPLFIKEIIKNRPDIVISIAFWFPGLCALLLKKLFKFRLLILTDATIATEHSIKFINRKYREMLLLLSDGCIASSPDTLDYLRTLLPVNRWDKIHLSRQTVNVTKWIDIANNLGDKKLLRTKLAIPIDKKVILGVGIIAKRKNWIRVLEMLPKLHNDIIFLLVGVGDQLAEFTARTEQLKVADRTIIAGEKSGRFLIEYYKASDIFILPTLYDQFGFVVVEALAVGLPVICSKYAGARCFIKDGYNGYVIDPDEDFADSINSSLSNTATMSTNSVKTASNYTLERKANELSIILREINPEV